MKKVTIEVPDDLDFNPDKFEYELVKKEKKELCYNDIAKKLFYDRSYFYINSSGEIKMAIDNESALDSNNCTSEKQAAKLLAIHKLMNVAKFLNKGWNPDWDNKDQEKYYIAVLDDHITVDAFYSYNGTEIYFKSREDAYRAVKILGEDIIKQALCTDY